MHYTNYPGSDIFGIVWHLEDKRCQHNNTKRDELFIHSEMTPDRKQACGKNKQGKYRENQCWDDDNRDYKSAGCIKVKPSDIEEAARLARAWGGPEPGQTHYSDLLLVTN